MSDGGTARASDGVAKHTVGVAVVVYQRGYESWPGLPALDGSRGIAMGCSCYRRTDRQTCCDSLSNTSHSGCDTACATEGSTVVPVLHRYHERFGFREPFDRDVAVH